MSNRNLTVKNHLLISSIILLVSLAMAGTKYHTNLFSTYKWLYTLHPQWKFYDRYEYFINFLIKCCSTLHIVLDGSYLTEPLLLCSSSVKASKPVPQAAARMLSPFTHQSCDLPVYRWLNYGSVHSQQMQPIIRTSKQGATPTSSTMYALAYCRHKLYSCR